MKLGITAALSFSTGLAAAVVGAFYVHKLTRSRDHDIWVRDSRIKEWQELLDALTKAYMLQLNSINDSDADGRKHDALANVDIVLSTRIFISDDVEHLEIRNKWAVLIRDLHLTRRTAIFELTIESKQLFKNGFQELRTSMVMVAKQTK